LSFDDLATVNLDEATTIYTFSRNGWINNRFEELSDLGHIRLLPTSRSPAAVFDSKNLCTLRTDLMTFFELLPREQRVLPEVALEQADEAEMVRCIELAPASLESAIASLNAARSRDVEAEGLETLICLLWCLLHLAEHAEANGLHIICVRSQ
jgi:hypothetical protein